MFGSFKSHAGGRARRPFSQQDVSVEHEVLGSEYGGWPIATAGVAAATTIYSFGAGYDISFDLTALERFGCSVLLFDPTPKSVMWMSQQRLPEQLKFHAIGIDETDGEASFFSPPHADHVSFAVCRTPSAGDQFAVKAPVMRLETIVSALADAPPDIVKLDIEGFEYRVIADILSGPIRPTQLLVEYHHARYGFDLDDTAMSVASLRNAGYRLFHVSESGREYGFIRS